MSGKNDVTFMGGDTYMGLMNESHGFVITAKSDEAASPAIKKPLINGEEDGNTEDWQHWGTDNLWPTRVRKLMETSTVAAPLIYKSVCRMYGSGLVYWQNVKEEAGIRKDFSEIPAVETFMEENPLDYIVLERMMDFRYYNNIFQEMIWNLSSNAPKIVETHHLESEFCRLSVQNKKTNEFDFIGIYGDWENFDSKSVSKVVNIPWKRMNTRMIIEKSFSKKKFAIHSKFPSPGRPIYGVPAHQSLFNKDGWLAFSNQIPKILNAVLKNGMNLKYHIMIPSNYWPSAHPGWEKMSEEKRKEVKKEKLMELNKWLTGVDNSMKSFISEYATDKITGKALPGWEIKELKDSSNFDKELLSSQESDAHITRALGEDPSQAGLQPQGGKMGAGSGSDKRTSFQNAISMSPAEQLVVLDFLYLIGKINGWPKNIRWGFQHDMPTTLNENKSGTEQITE